MVRLQESFEESREVEGSASRGCRRAVTDMRVWKIGEDDAIVCRIVAVDIRVQMWQLQWGECHWQ